MTGRWQSWIDRGGRFTDGVARRPDGTLVTHKLLAENPERYRDAAIAAIRELLDLGPVLESFSIRRGSGGAGRWRGGGGVVRRLRFLEPMTAAILAGHRRVPPHGMAGCPGLSDPATSSAQTEGGSGWEARTRRR
jgi:hypothetical protein